MNALKGHFFLQKKLYVTGRMGSKNPSSGSTYVEEMFDNAEEELTSPPAITVA